MAYIIIYLYVLNSFDVEVIYLKGSSNHIPDFFSRYGVEKGDSLVSEQEIDKFIDNRLLPITKRINTNRGCSPQKLLKNELQNCRVNTLKPNQAWALLNDDLPSTIKRLLFKSSNKSPEIEPSWKFDIPEFEHSEQSSQKLNERELIKSDIECDNTTDILSDLDTPEIDTENNKNIDTTKPDVLQNRLKLKAPTVSLHKQSVQWQMYLCNRLSRPNKYTLYYKSNQF